MQTEQTITLGEIDEGARLLKGDSPTLRDLSDKCAVSHLFGDVFRVTTETGHTYRVRVTWVEGRVFARCNCPIAVYRKRDCRHAYAVRRFEEYRVSSARFGEGY